jgi:hypothetical protein
VSKLWASLYETYRTLYENCLKRVEGKSERLEELDVNRKGEGGSKRCEGVIRGLLDTVDLEAGSIAISRFCSIFQVFVDLGAVDAGSVLSRALLSGQTKKAFPASPHNKVEQSRDAPSSPSQGFLVTCNTYANLAIQRSSSSCQRSCSLDKQTARRKSKTLCWAPSFFAFNLHFSPFQALALPHHLVFSLSLAQSFLHPRCCSATTLCFSLSLHFFTTLCSPDERLRSR